MQTSLPVDCLLKQSTPYLGGGRFSNEKLSTYDLFEDLQHLYVRVMKAKDLPGKGVGGSLDPYVEVRVGQCWSMTRHFEKKSNPEWNQVLVFYKDNIQATILEVTVKDKDLVKDDSVGRVMFDLNEIPKRAPRDSPLAPQWYTLEDRNGNKVKGELMLAVWMGTQADEAFTEAVSWVQHIGAKVYLSPKLWYLRVHVIEAQDLIPGDRSRFTEVYVKAILGNQALRTKVSVSKTIDPTWSEDMLFVAAEPFEEPLILSVEDRVAPNKNEVLGRCSIPLEHVDKRLDPKPVDSRWYNLEKQIIVDEEKKEMNLASRIHIRVCLEGGYHVLDESTHYSSDLRPTDKQLWKSSIGVLELGILTARGLTPMKIKDGRATTDAYCVAKYGQKWVKTRTIIDCFTPKWYELYTWEVFDPCTVITIDVFDNCLLHGRDKSGVARDSIIGKVRIRLSMLETNHLYTYYYPLMFLHHTGLKKMGEIHLAIRFSCTSLMKMKMMHMYSQPLFPELHYLHPLTTSQLESLTHQATQIVCARLNRADPPLRKEIVEYMLDVGSHMWSFRRSKANFLRIVCLVSRLTSLQRWFDQICNWKNPITTVLIHILFLILVLYLQLIPPVIFLCLFLIGVWNYRSRPIHPMVMDVRVSCADNPHPDELDEEFDTFPSSYPPDIVRMRYDRIRSILGRILSVVGDLAALGEKLQSLLTWTDPRATTLFVIFCLIAAIVLCVMPFRVVALLTGFYVLRHPRFRNKQASVPLNFFERLPSKQFMFPLECNREV